MDFEPSDEQAMIGRGADLFGTRHYPAADRLTQLAAGPEASAARWREMAALGWLGLGVSEARGGAGGDATHVMALTQGFGRHLMLEPYVTRCVLAPALLEAGTTPLVDTLVAGIAGGTVAVALALGEPGGGFDLHRVATTAGPVADGFRLSGDKDHVEDGADAGWFVVPARTRGAADDADGLSLFLVQRDALGLRVERFRAIDGHRHARLRLDGVALHGDALIGPLHHGLPILERAVDRAIAAHLAEAVGSMDVLRDISLDYLKTRRQFGQPIGAFQALQHRMVDIDIACEEARSMVYHATAALAADDAVRRRAIAAAKTRVGQCGLFVGRQAVQLHGGLGISAELIVSHHLKRQMMLDLAYGNAGHHRARFAALTAAAA